MVRFMIRRLASFPGVLVPALALAGCGSPDAGSGPGGVTASEAEALDDAAEMIEQRRLPAPEEESAAEGEGTEKTSAEQP